MKTKIAREIQLFAAAYLFGLYESRGGAVCVLARNHIDAIIACLELNHEDVLKRSEEDRELADYIDVMIDAVQDGFIGRYQLHVCDRPLPAPGRELLASHRDDDAGYRFGVVQSRYWYVKHTESCPVGEEAWSSWADTPHAVLWQGAMPEITLHKGSIQEEYRIDERRIGDGTCGVTLLQAG